MRTCCRIEDGRPLRISTRKCPTLHVLRNRLFWSIYREGKMQKSLSTTESYLHVWLQGQFISRSLACSTQIHYSTHLDDSLADTDQFASCAVIREQTSWACNESLPKLWMRWTKRTSRQAFLRGQCDWITFKMKVPLASHMGGVWQHQIRTVLADSDSPEPLSQVTS